MKLENKSSRDYIAYNVVLKANSVQDITDKKACKVLLKQPGVSEYADLVTQKDLQSENEELKKQLEAVKKQVKHTKAKSKARK